MGRLANWFNIKCCAVVLAGLVALPSPAFAQLVDPRVSQLEEQVRQLNGQIEELNFQLLQLQDQIRRTQEDNEFRLQQLEDDGEQQGALPDPVDEGGSEFASTSNTEEAPTTAKAPRLDNVAEQITAQLPPVSVDSRGSPPRNLGTLTIDPSGAISETTVDFSTQNVARSIDGTNVASVTLTGNAEELYQIGYGHVLQGDYRLAEGVFESFVEAYPDDPLTPDARFWLAESVLGQGRFEDAAEIFIDTHSRYPRADKAPETMLKIGTIMAALGNRDVACVTFSDALREYDGMAQKTRARLQSEQQQARC